MTCRKQEQENIEVPSSVKANRLYPLRKGIYWKRAFPSPTQKFLLYTEGVRDSRSSHTELLSESDSIASFLSTYSAGKIFNILEKSPISSIAWNSYTEGMK